MKLKKRPFMFILPGIVLLIISGCISGSSDSFRKKDAERLPNFVVFFTDDQGYGDLGCFGGNHVSTPNIDRLARKGIKLTAFYVAALCTPSRAALMTGCYPKRISMATGSHFPVLLAGESKGLNPDELTMAEILKNQGYASAIYGKWHLGDQPEFLPTRQGFDEFYGIPYSHDIHPFHPRQDHFNFPPLPLYHNETVVETDPDADYFTRDITERALKFIQDNKKTPFFLYIPYPMPHHPIHVSPGRMGTVPDSVRLLVEQEGDTVNYTSRTGLYPAAIAEIDWSVGQIVESLESLHLDSNTFIFFTSDNGPDAAYGCEALGSAGPLRGRKGSTYEGGMRVPAVAYWPGRIPAGSESGELVTSMDLLPTFTRLTGASIPKDRRIDGKDIWPVLSGQPDAKSPHDRFYYFAANKLRAVRSGPWKYHQILPGRRISRGDSTSALSALYNLETDIGESRDLAAQYPEIVEKLENMIHDFELELGKGDSLGTQCRPAGWKEDPRPPHQKDKAVALREYFDAREFRFEEVSGIGYEKGCTRRDPSDVIKAGDTCYVYYTKVYGRSPGYWGTIWCASSSDEGHTWKEEGEVLGVGADGSFDSQATFTPNVIYAEGSYYLFYTGVRPTPGRSDGVFENNNVNDFTAVGVASADSPDGPFFRLNDGRPVLEVSSGINSFDSYRVDDAALLIRDRKYWLYYKGRDVEHGESGPGETKMGVAFSTRPEGPYVKYENNPLLDKSHEVMVWKQGKGVACLASLSSTIEYAPDGLNFTTPLLNAKVPSNSRPKAPGACRTDLVNRKVESSGLSWGISMVHNGDEAYLKRWSLDKKIISQ